MAARSPWKQQRCFTFCLDCNYCIYDCVSLLFVPPLLGSLPPFLCPFPCTTLLRRHSSAQPGFTGLTPLCSGTLSVAKPEKLLTDYLFNCFWYAALPFRKIRFKHLLNAQVPLPFISSSSTAVIGAKLQATVSQRLKEHFYRMSADKQGLKFIFHILHSHELADCSAMLRPQSSEGIVAGWKIWN